MRRPPSMAVPHAFRPRRKYDFNGPVLPQQVTKRGPGETRRGLKIPDHRTRRGEGAQCVQPMRRGIKVSLKRWEQNASRRQRFRPAT
ncbi:hypothetical protein STPYR_11578 [uncultured Stenotrophomonas sp.]|uniref:Uncharacterized protein n=1 Tax=uncultured Stenotrophomonas sp. TaxID=165438 RepID=A0A1Y5Q2Z9_9GAMM|nr:hypothetical protein STPYR_11578 [uncultured Stenotrophomonas sp.]